LRIIGLKAYKKGYTGFLKTPVYISALDMETLDRIHMNRGRDDQD